MELQLGAKGVHVEHRGGLVGTVSRIMRETVSELGLLAGAMD